MRRLSEVPQEELEAGLFLQYRHSGDSNPKLYVSPPGSGEWEHYSRSKYYAIAKNWEKSRFGKNFFDESGQLLICFLATTKNIPYELVSVNT